MHDVHDCYKGFFNSASGQVINIRKPDIDTILIEDIAGGLSKICRFGGQINEFYSVAQHSILVCFLAPDELKFEALMHDASEAFLGDVIKPLKVIIGDVYADIEDTFMDAICDKFLLDADKLKAVKEFDKQALSLEHEWFQRGDITAYYAFWQRINSLGSFGTYTPQAGKEEFLNYYRKYRKL